MPLDDWAKQTLVELEDKDNEINSKIDWAVQDSESKYNEIKKRSENHQNFFNGKQIAYQIPKYKSDSVFNYIFPGVVNIVGLLTDAKIEPQVHPLPADDEVALEENRLKAENFERTLRCLWISRQIPDKLLPALYRLIIEEDVVLMPKWNYEDDDIDVEVSPITLWRFASGADSIEDSPWAVRCIEKSWQFFVDNFPDKLDKIKEAIQKNTKNSAKEGKFEIQEYFTDRIYIMRVGKLILKKRLNPYFEFRSEEEQREDFTNQGLEGTRFEGIKNYFKSPKKPIIGLSAYNLGEVYSRSRMEQLLKPQIDLNKRFQQIDDNLVLGASGIWIYDTLMISKSEMDKVTFKPFQKIGVPGGSSSLHREAGSGLPPGMIDNVMQLHRGFDDIFGHHEVSRGQKVRTQTFGEAALLREADQTSIRLLGRNYQAALERLMKYWTQLISLFYTKKHYAQWLDDMGVKQITGLSRKDITPGMHVTVTVGAQLSKDKADQRNEASMLGQTGQIDPLTMFETLNYPTPRKLANRIANWRNFGVISDEQLPAPGMEGGVVPGQTNEQVLRQEAALAAEENERMAAGESISVRPEEVHEVHLEIHQSFPNQNQLIKAHIQEHTEFLQERGERQE